MLTLDEVRRQRRRRPPPSLKQQYEEYVMQRIETFKNSLPRGDLLRLGDDAFAELQSAAESQFILTEVLMAESVDRMITRRLGIPSYRKWRANYAALREAQREPNHWGLDGGSAVARLVPRIERGDHVLVVGAAAEPAAYLMAAHDAAVTFVAADLGVVERAEQRMAEESLASQFMGLVVALGHWFPVLESPANVAIVDAGALVDMDPADRPGLMAMLQGATAPNGVHVVVPGTPALAPEALLPFYPDWIREDLSNGRRKGARRSEGIILAKPACLTDTDMDASEAHAPGAWEQ